MQERAASPGRLVQPSGSVGAQQSHVDLRWQGHCCFCSQSHTMRRRTALHSSKPRNPCMLPQGALLFMQIIYKLIRKVLMRWQQGFFLTISRRWTNGNVEVSNPTSHVTSQNCRIYTREEPARHLLKSFLSLYIRGSEPRSKAGSKAGAPCERTASPTRQPPVNGPAFTDKLLHVSKGTIKISDFKCVFTLREMYILKIS